MVNILLEGYNIDAGWLYNDLNNYIKPYHKVAVVAFSFRHSRVKNKEAWDNLYSKEKGIYYKGIVESFFRYGVVENNIEFLDYFTDTKETAKDKIKNADIIYFLGGMPEKMFDRLVEFDLVDTISSHKGIVMGYSAGALIQLSEYHLSEATGYPNFAYYSGLDFISDFYLEVHYDGSEKYLTAISRVKEEKGKTVYALHKMSGAIIVDNGDIKLIGDVTVF